MSNNYTDKEHHEDIKVLHGMGYAQELQRSMSKFSNFAISFSIICILSGGINSFAQAISSVGGAARVSAGSPVASFQACSRSPWRRSLQPSRPQAACIIGFHPRFPLLGLVDSLAEPSWPHH